MKKNKTRNEDLELEFVLACKEATELINKKIELASKNLKEAVEISEKYGIPFYSSISPLSNTYTPDSFKEKYGSIDKDLFYSNDFACGSEYNTGWEHSAVC